MVVIVVIIIIIITITIIIIIVIVIIHIVIIDFYCSIHRTRHDQIGGDILEMLLSFTDFMAFKEMFLEYKSVSILSSLFLEKTHLAI